MATDKTWISNLGTFHFIVVPITQDSNDLDSIFGFFITLTTFEVNNIFNAWPLPKNVLNLKSNYYAILSLLISLTHTVE